MREIYALRKASTEDQEFLDDYQSELEVLETRKRDLARSIDQVRSLMSVETRPHELAKLIDKQKHMIDIDMGNDHSIGIFKKELDKRFSNVEGNNKKIRELENTIKANKEQKEKLEKMKKFVLESITMASVSYKSYDKFMEKVVFI